MIQIFLFSFWFFLPAGFANMAPVFASKIPFLSQLSYPIDFYKTYKNKRIFGDHKTIRGLISGVVFGIFIAYVQSVLYARFQFLHFFIPSYFQQLNPFLLGGLLGLGALLGDMGKSFLKRQLAISPGKSWFLFDQIDYIIGGILLSLLYVRFPITIYIATCILWFCLHIIVSFVGFLLKLKESPI